MSKVIFAPPGPDAPGFLRRLRQAMYFQEVIQSKHYTSGDMEQMVEFMADFVVEPADRAEAIQLLWDASQAQFMEMLKAISGGDDEAPFDEGSAGTPSATP